MASFLDSISGYLAIAAAAISIIVGYGTVRERKNAPNEKRWKEATEKNEKRWDELRMWREHVDDALDNDSRHIKRFENEFIRHDEFQRITLKALKGIIGAMADGNTKNELPSVGKEIDEYLLNGRHYSSSDQF